MSMIKRIGKPRNAIIPKIGSSGPFEMDMFRGIDEDVREKNGFKYASDSGDYGRGEYWARDKSFARIYGKVITKRVILNNALHLPSNEIVILARDTYGTTINRGKGHCRFNAAQKLTNDMLAKGYDGIVIYGYERPNMWSACIFKP
jgi:hypothetical protein